MTAWLDLPMARAAAESLMTSTCTIFAAGGEQVTDPVTGEVTTTPDVIWSGPCRVRPGSGQSTTTVRVAGVEAFTFDYLVSVPFAVDTVIEGHRVTITSSPDPALAGVTVEVQRVGRGDHLSARRLMCREVA